MTAAKILDVFQMSAVICACRSTYPPTENLLTGRFSPRNIIKILKVIVNRTNILKLFY